jgi:sugar O-acyltransferase (sialic acid O-acetyltransferase NeuD family)
VIARPLLLLGSGGLAREVLAAVRLMPDQWRPIGALDDNPALHHGEIDGLPVLGGIELVYEHPDAAVLACVANSARPWARARLVDRLRLHPERWATIVHPGASVAQGVEVGHGTMLLAGVVVTAPMQIAAHVLAMPHVLITHDNEVGSFTTFAGRVTLGGGVRVGEQAFLGQGALVRENVTIGQGAVIGMGSVVLCDVPPEETWAGVPARRLGPQ